MSSDDVSTGGEAANDTKKSKNNRTAVTATPVLNQTWVQAGEGGGTGDWLVQSGVGEKAICHLVISGLVLTVGVFSIKESGVCFTLAVRAGMILIF